MRFLFSLHKQILNKEVKVVTIVLNQTNKNITYSLCVGAKTTEIYILPHAIQTVVLIMKL